VYIDAENNHTWKYVRIGRIKDFLTRIHG
jgi:hypothetical protein